jgi:hypothetical protein
MSVLAVIVFAADQAELAVAGYLAELPHMRAFRLYLANNAVDLLIELAAFGV